MATKMCFNLFSAAMVAVIVTIACPRCAEAEDLVAVYLHGNQIATDTSPSEKTGWSSFHAADIGKTDSVISFEVTMALKEYGSYVFVYTENGRVELTGYVMDANDIGMVERMAWEVEGVTEVSLSLEAPAWINEEWEPQAQD